MWSQSTVHSTWTGLSWTPVCEQPHWNIYVSRTRRAPTVLVSLPPIKSWRWRSWPKRVVTRRVTVSICCMSVQFRSVRHVLWTSLSRPSVRQNERHCCCCASTTIKISLLHLLLHYRSPQLLQLMLCITQRLAFCVRSGRKPRCSYQSVNVLYTEKHQSNALPCSR